jgi:hypothetical protein
LFTTRCEIKFYVDKESAVVIKSKERKNYDSMKWGSWPGGTKLNNGVSTMKCQDGVSCDFRKKRWDCAGSCLGERFCCNLFDDEDLVITVYLGSHNHDKSNKDLDVDNIKQGGLDDLLKTAECSDKWGGM